MPQIIHIALKEIDIKIQKKNIYIEVKAVPHSNFQFHFSSSEYQTAYRLKNFYFVYLIPVDHSQPSSFDINALLKINNIHKNIFENKNWKVSEDGYLISKKGDRIK